MTGGVISGGWEFVWAAYGITAALFIVYTISLFVRLREVTKK
jgi:heme exporter protein D